VARVDADDDTIRRFVVHHCRYDPDRHERRHVVIAAFDNEADWKACMFEAQAELDRRRKNGGDVEPNEHVSGVILEPGHRCRNQDARIIRRAIEHGVLPASSEALELPSNFAILQAGARRKPSRWQRIFNWFRVWSGRRRA
jgi:hypothetical protein